jgi:hypothetical protein
MYKFFYFKIETKTKADLYMPCKAMAHSTCSRSSYDDDGRMQGGKSTAACRPEFQMVNKVAGGLYLVT